MVALESDTLRFESYLCRLLGKLLQLYFMEEMVNHVKTSD